MRAVKLTGTEYPIVLFIDHIVYIYPSGAETVVGTNECEFLVDEPYDVVVEKVMEASNG